MTHPPEVEERAKALREAATEVVRWSVSRALIQEPVRAEEVVAYNHLYKATVEAIIRAIVTELGITQEMVDTVRLSANDTESAIVGNPRENTEHARVTMKAADALSVLLAAAGGSDE